LRFIKRAKAVGFTPEEVASLLELRSHACCSATPMMAASKLKMIEQRLDELQRLCIELTQWISDCDANATDTDCPVIDHLQARN
jgi:DNA-binding transcriptional MerR regulator